MIKAGMRVFAYQVDSDRTDIATITHINQYTHTDAIDYEVLADIGDTYITPFVCPLVIADDIEKTNFNPQMLKSCTDTSYQCGYQQGKLDGAREFAEWLSSKGYLSFIEYDEDEDFEGNMKLDVREESLDVDEVISEWQEWQKLRNS